MDAPVVAAVRASASYPFVFEPVKTHDKCLLSDGGLASNLPAFLFAKEHRATGFPFSLSIWNPNKQSVGVRVPWHSWAGFFLPT
jgi:predicted acylesterase/phospholipase RssA